MCIFFFFLWDVMLFYVSICNAKSMFRYILLKAIVKMTRERLKKNALYQWRGKKWFRCVKMRNMRYSPFLTTQRGSVINISLLSIWREKSMFLLDEEYHELSLFRSPVKYIRYAPRPGAWILLTTRSQKAPTEVGCQTGKEIILFCFFKDEYYYGKCYCTIKLNLCVVNDGDITTNTPSLSNSNGIHLRWPIS